jgi:amino acid transporter
MSNTSAGGEQRIFLRKASGLIRSASLTDVLIYDIGVVSVGLGVGTMMYYGPAFYPGGDLIWGCIIAGFMMALICLGMISWSVTLPRSGGVYVFGSRSLWPFLAHAISFVEIFAWLFYCAIAAFWIVRLGLAPAFAMIGYLTGSELFQGLSAAMYTPTWTFIVGSAILILSSLILSSGMKFFLLTQKIVFVVAMIGSVLLIVILIPYSNEDFIATFNGMMGPIMGVDSPYQAIIASAASNPGGAWTTEGSDFWTTVKVSNWAFLPLLGAAFSISIAGEIKSVEKSQVVGMLGAIVLNVVIWIITISLANSVFGYDFIGSAVYNYWVPGEGVITTPTDATITLLAGILTQSWVVAVLVSLGLITWIWMWIPAMHTYGVRAVVAWAFDRIAPAQFGAISQKSHTPTFSIWATTALNIVFMALFSFTQTFSTVIILIEAALLAWMIVLGAGVFFPYSRPHIYQKSPIYKKTILGLPMMTVTCGLGFLGALFYFLVLWNDPVAAGHNPDQVRLVAGVFVLAIAWYVVMYLYRKSQGIDVNLAFKEIPIE